LLEGVLFPTPTNRRSKIKLPQGVSCGQGC
jgi:hypothetical protein